MLAEEGYFSHGVEVSGTESLSGHGADRITSLLGGDLMVGDGEQYAAAMALMRKGGDEMSAQEIAETALNIAGSICVFTNQNLTIEELDSAN